MGNPFIKKLEHAVRLTDAERQVLQGAVRNARHIGAREDIIREGDKPDHVHAVLEGFACRYKNLPNGQRQILAWLIPGDICDLHVAILGEMDHSIATLAPCRIGYIGQDTIADLTSNHPAINRALWWATLVDEGILREWLANMGRRPADRQVAHLVCELLMRLQAVGLAQDDSFDFPLTQEEFADTLGISTVHVNRMLQQLREAGLITLAGKRLGVLDPDGLKTFAEFNPNYLHLHNSRSAVVGPPNAAVA